MRVLLYCLLANAGSVAFAESPAPITVVLDFEKPPSHISYESMRGELDRLLNDAAA